MHPNGEDRMANSVDPDQEQSDLGLHCLPRPICPKTYDHYGSYLSFIKEISGRECYLTYLSTIFFLTLYTLASTPENAFHKTKSVRNKENIPNSGKYEEKYFM